MEMQKVAFSSQIDSIGYDAFDGTLAVLFKGNSLYHYHNVPHNIYTAMIASPSVGKFFAEHIKGGDFQYTKQLPPEAVKP